MAQADVNKDLPKHDWYQTEAQVMITVLKKKVNPNQLKVNFEPSIVEVDVEDYHLCYNLAHRIVPEHCSYKITPSMIELKLTKADDIRWEKLQGATDDSTLKTIPQNVILTNGPPPYPTSKKGKDWSVVEKEITAEEKNEKPQGDEALNKLFQGIYGSGNDEIRRAMNKSYLESGGTVLSTNWKDIEKKTVEVKPPDGMEWKKW